MKSFEDLEMPRLGGLFHVMYEDPNKDAIQNRSSAIPWPGISWLQIFRIMITYCIKYYTLWNFEEHFGVEDYSTV